MSIITISRGSYRLGKEVAEKVAQKLRFECISRDVLIEALNQFHIPEIKLVRKIHDATSILERFSYGKERYIANIRAALLKHLKKDNVVYHGLAGHFFVKGISHVFKVRIIAGMETRVKEEMKRENISAKEARYILKKDDEERRKWSLYLYGIDTWNPSLYDMVLNIDAISVDDAVDIISNTIKLPCFQTTSEGQRQVENLALAAQVQATMFEFPTANVSAKDGSVLVSLKAPVDQQEEITLNIENLIRKIPEVKEIKMRFEPYL